MSSIKSPPSREKFCLMSTVWFVLQKPFMSLQKGIHLASWDRLCATLFGFNQAEIEWDKSKDWGLMHDPTNYRVIQDHSCYGDLHGDLALTKRFIPEPILSHRLAHVAISCMQYLHHQDLNTFPTWDYLLAWEIKSKQSPWLWRQQMRVTSMGCQQSSWNYDGRNAHFPRASDNHTICYIPK